MSFIPPLRVVACIIEHDGKFLITQRLKRSHLGHLWEFPGGKIEAGESLEDCAIRECREELDIEVRPLDLLQEIQHDYPEVSVHLYFMRCEWVGGEPKAIECADWRWLRADELSGYEFPEADREIIRQLSLHD
jgi:mutator protein MutT